MTKFMTYPANLEDCSLYDFKPVSDIRPESQKTQTAFYHVIHLISDVLKPVLCGLDPRYHSRQLASDDGLRMKGLSKGLSLGSPPVRDN